MRTKCVGQICHITSRSRRSLRSLGLAQPGLLRSLPRLCSPLSSALGAHVLNKVKLALTLLFGITIGFIAGIRYSWPVYISWNSQNEAGEITVDLKRLKAKEYDKIIQEKELNLNMQFYLHGMYLESPLRFLIPSNEVDRKIMESAVSYRKDNPYPLKDLSEDQTFKNSLDSELLSNLHKGYEIQKTEIEKVQKIYAK